VRRNELGGNGSAFRVANGLSNDFGIGVIGSSSDNVVEENGFAGNMNGVFLSGVDTLRNVIRRNVFAGNPPMQIEVTFGKIGFDIQNLSPAGANSFEENLCRTYFGAGPDPCLTLPKFAGHRNTSRSSSRVKQP
jgi:hypothetical protein